MIESDWIQMRYEQDRPHRLTLDEVRRYAQHAATETGETRVVVSTPDGVYLHTTQKVWEEGKTYGPGCFTVGLPVGP